MATRKKGAQILFPLESAEAFQKAVDESEKFLAVVDVYQSWTGPTSVMEPVFRRIKMEKERVPERARERARARARTRANAQSGALAAAAAASRCRGRGSSAARSRSAAPLTLPRPLARPLSAASSW